MCKGAFAPFASRALNALLFLYREVIGGEMAWVDARCMQSARKRCLRRQRGFGTG